MILASLITIHYRVCKPRNIYFWELELYPKTNEDNGMSHNPCTYGEQYYVSEVLPATTARRSINDVTCTCLPIDLGKLEYFTNLN